MIKPSKEFLEVFKNTDGALSVTESIAIMNIAAQVPEGNRSVEFGVYKGKSAMSAAVGLKSSMFYLVEPEFNDITWNDKVYEKVEIFLDEFSDLSLKAHTSIEWLNSNERKFGNVFIDSGSHQDGLPMQEVKLLEDRVIKGGIIAFHDYKSQFIEVEEAYDYLLRTDKYEEINIDWNEIIEYVNENNLEEGNKSWHHNELKNPCFVGALRRK